MQRVKKRRKEDVTVNLICVDNDVSTLRRIEMICKKILNWMKQKLFQRYGTQWNGWRVVILLILPCWELTEI